MKRLLAVPDSVRGRRLVLPGLGKVLAVSSVELGGAAMAPEHRAYEVLRREGSLELRHYPAYLTANVTVGSDGYNEAAYAGFDALAGYIFGNNAAAGSIRMTAPVTASRSPGTRIDMTVPVTSELVRDEELEEASPLCTVSCAGEYVVRFTMPAQYVSVEDLPAPNDPRVSLEAVPEHLAVAGRFSGRLEDETIAAEIGRLEEWVVREGLEVIGEPEAAQFDAPWKPAFVRHNEVLIPVRRA